MFSSIQFIFRPYLTVVCLLMIFVLAFLGTWQVFRAQEKESLQEEFDQKYALPSQPLMSLLNERNSAQHEILIFRKVSASGVLMPESAFFVDNVIMDGKPGFLLHTPMKLDNGKVIVLNHGWMEAGKRRGDLPVIERGALSVSVTGLLVEPRSKPVLLGDLPRPDIEKEGLWFYVDLEYLEAQLKQEVLPWVLELAPDDPLSEQVKTTTYNAKVGMHIGYAIQWYVFILFVLIGYLAMTIRKRQAS